MINSSNLPKTISNLHRNGNNISSTECHEDRDSLCSVFSPSAKFWYFLSRINSKNEVQINLKSPKSSTMWSSDSEEKHFSLFLNVSFLHGEKLHTSFFRQRKDAQIMKWRTTTSKTLLQQRLKIKQSNQRVIDFNRRFSCVRFHDKENFLQTTKIATSNSLEKVRLIVFID